MGAENRERVRAPQNQFRIRMWHAALERRAADAVRALLLLALKGYQLAIRPLLGQHCRFHPSCSCYAATAIARHGPWRGLVLAGGRLLRCHPWHPGGLDPVPEPLQVTGRREPAADA